MKKPKHVSLIVVYGPAGVGKTTLADLLHDELSFTAHIGVDHIKRFISEFRDIASHQVVSRKVIDAMVEEYLETGISVIVEQGMTRAEIETLQKIAEEHNANFLVYRLDASRAVADERALKRQEALGKPPISKEEFDDHSIIHQENDYPATHAFDTETMSTRQMADEVLLDLRTSE